MATILNSASRTAETPAAERAFPPDCASFRKSTLSPIAAIARVNTIFPKNFSR